jgi:osmotically-inducible protein OsmY
MLRQSTAGKLMFAFLLASVFVAGSFARPVAKTLPASQPNPQKADCSSTSDADIVKAVVENIKKQFKDDQIKSQIHVNITAQNGIVEISGDAHGINRKNPREVRTRITTIARKTACVKKVVTRHLTQDHPIKCTKTQKQCNGGCIDQNQQCNPL